MQTKLAALRRPRSLLTEARCNQKMPQRTFYCLNGLGYFGSRSLAAAVQLRSSLANRRTPVSVEIFALADPNADARSTAVAALRRLHVAKEFQLGSRLSDILLQIRLQFARGVGKDDQFVIHDCSPTWAHLANTEQVAQLMHDTPALRRRVKYLVEKPSMTATQSERRLAENETLTSLPDLGYCDYIELQSETFLTARRWLDQNSDFEPTDLEVWRNSSTGFKRLFDRSRAGVTGGALEDKAAHDLALSVGLLGWPDRSPTDIDAEIENFLPAEWETSDLRPRFNTVDNFTVQFLQRFNEGDTRLGHSLAFDISDARIWARFGWPLATGRTVNCTYHFSWDGVDEVLSERLAEIGLGEVGVVGEELVQSDDDTFAYRIREARVHIVTDGSRARPRRLVLSFLSKFKDLDPFVVYIDGSHRVKRVPLLTLPGGDNSLFRQLSAVITRDPAATLGRGPTDLINETVHAIRSAATDKPAPPPSQLGAAMAETVSKIVKRSSYERLRAYSGFVFDLDNTLINTRAVSGAILRPVVAALRQSSQTRHSAWYTKLTRRLAWRPLDDHQLDAEFAFTDEEREILRREMAFLRVDASTAPPLFDDAETMIDHLSELRDAGMLEANRLRCALLTRGFGEFQWSKIRAHPKLREFFGEEIFVDDVQQGRGRPGQAVYLREIAARWDCAHRRVLVVGDNPDAELAAALEVGMATALLVRSGAERSHLRSANSAVHRQVADLRTVAERFVIEWPRP